MGLRIQLVEPNQLAIYKRGPGFKLTTAENNPASGLGWT